MNEKTIGQAAQIPNPALKPFEKLIGTWKTEGTHGMMPGVTVHGNTSFEWIEGGAFLMIRSEIVDDNRFPNGMAIIGSDDEQKEFFMLYFDSRGVSRIQHVYIEEQGRVIRWERNQPGFSQHYTMTLSDDDKTMTSHGELCTDGVTWEKDLDLKYMRSK